MFIFWFKLKAALLIYPWKKVKNVLQTGHIEAIKETEEKHQQNGEKNTTYLQGYNNEIWNYPIPLENFENSFSDNSKIKKKKKIR